MTINYEMAMDAETQKIREFFQGDKFATENYAEIVKVADNYSLCKMTLCDRHKNARGNLMGGAMFTLSDFAFAVASNHNGDSVVSINSNINMIGNCKGDVIYAEAKCIKNGRTTCTYEVTVKDNQDRLLAVTTILGFHMN